MRRTGVIDIGSNSMRLVVIETLDNGSFRIINEAKETVRLGKNMTSDGKLNTERMNAAIDTIGYFCDICRGLGAEDIEGVATAAVRWSSNRNEFEERVYSETGLKLRVLSGEEEAYYDYFGIMNSIDINDGLIMDIGGGSAEIIYFKDRKIKESISLPFGAITLTEKFGLGDVILKKNEEMLMEYLRKEYGNIPWLKNAKSKVLIGVGGTIRNIAKIDRKSGNYILDYTHNYTMKAGNVMNIYNMAREGDIKQRKRIKGLSSDRADIFPGAAAAVAVLIDFCSIDEIIVSGSGIREGLIYEKILGGKEPVKDVLDASIDNILGLHNVNRIHADRVYRLSNRLYEELKPLHGLGDENKKVLKTASMLHDIGKSVNYYDHHKHTFYIITNSGLNGLSHRENVMAAYAAALHRKSEFALSMPYSSVIGEAENRIAQVIGTVIKIADNLETRLDGNVKDIRVSNFEDTIVIKVLSNEDPGLEIRNAMDASGTFLKVFGKRLIVV